MHHDTSGDNVPFLDHKTIVSQEAISNERCRQLWRPRLWRRRDDRLRWARAPRLRAARQPVGRDAVSTIAAGIRLTTGRYGRLASVAALAGGKMRGSVACSFRPFQVSVAPSAATTLRAQFVLGPRGSPMTMMLFSPVGTTAIGVAYALPLCTNRLDSLSTTYHNAHE